MLKRCAFKDKLHCPGSVPTKICEKRWSSAIKIVIRASNLNCVVTFLDMCTNMD